MLGRTTLTTHTTPAAHARLARLTLASILALSLALAAPITLTGCASSSSSAPAASSATDSNSSTQNGPSANDPSVQPNITTQYPALTGLQSSSIISFNGPSGAALLTACAASKSPNDPAGSDQSPELSWDAVPNAAGYVVLMYDYSANWLHWLAPSVTTTSLAQGAYTDPSAYVGPYPSSSSGTHMYNIYVLAVSQLPTNLPFTVDTQVPDINSIINAINTANNSTNNILAEGELDATYTYGDNNQ
jgi:phosphatidylethanolamine-binding protein (PEBP) family uncharacterized protein